MSNRTMCLTLYLATRDAQPLQDSPELRVEDVDASCAPVSQWFSLPTVRYIGAHTGCSCGFPSVTGDEPVEYSDGMFDEDANRQADLKSVRALLDLVRQHVTATGEAELYPVWDGDEASPPKGTIDLPLETLDPETFFFNERFLHRVTRGAATAPAPAPA